MTEQTITNLELMVIKQDLPAYKVAGACGIHPTTFGEYRHGKKAIQPKHLRALCKYFGCDQRDLLGTTTYEL